MSKARVAQRSDAHSLGIMAALAAVTGQVVPARELGRMAAREAALELEPEWQRLARVHHQWLLDSRKGPSDLDWQQDGPMVVFAAETQQAQREVAR